MVLCCWGFIRVLTGVKIHMAFFAKCLRFYLIFFQNYGFAGFHILEYKIGQLKSGNCFETWSRFSSSRLYLNVSKIYPRKHLKKKQ